MKKKAIKDGHVCDGCASDARLIYAGDGYTSHNTDVCGTCGKHTQVLPVSLYVLPPDVDLMRSGDVNSLRSELDNLKKLFNEQSDLYEAACKKIELLETDIRAMRLGSRWSGIS